MPAQTRELTPAEFHLAEKIWEQYRGQKADPAKERIFAVFDNGNLAATARFTRHPDGNEMDCVFSLDEYRGRDMPGRWCRPSSMPAARRPFTSTRRSS